MENVEFLKDILDLTGYDTDTRTSRRKGSGGTQEFFTPYELVLKMCNKVPEEKWNDVNADFLEPSAGNGNFVLAILFFKMQHGSTWRQALEHTWSVELMEDNLNEMYERIFNMMKKLKIEDFDREEALKIMKNNFVCSDFFKWDFENWRPLKEDKGPQSIELF